MTTQELLIAAKQASPRIRTASTEVKNKALLAMAECLLTHKSRILEANKADMENARGLISEVMLDRLALSESRIEAMAEGIRQVAELPDPVGRELSRVTRPNGMVIRRVSVPIGVIAIIYESRPNVTADAAALAVKSGNACILRGGKEAFHSALAISEALKEGLVSAGLPGECIGFVTDTTRQSANELMKANGYVDLLIPRGGAQLINACIQNATVPCIQTGTGICHVYVDKAADQEMALNIIQNAKTSRPSVCNAAEVCLVHREIAEEFLPKLKNRLQNVELRTDGRAYAIIGGTPAGERDFDTEFLDYILAVGVVDSLEMAEAHISAHSTGHSEAIITDDPERAEHFTRHIDSAAVYVNTSTRFTDGGEFGLGCEMGISTQKLHARGPMGLEELTSYQYIIQSSGAVR